MAFNYKLIASIIGTAGTGVGITTPLVVNATSKTYKSDSVKIASLNIQKNELSSQDLGTNEKLDDSQLSTSSGLGQNLIEVKDDLLIGIKIEEENPDLLEALRIVKESRQNRSIYQHKRLSWEQKEELEKLYERITTSEDLSNYDVRSGLNRINWTEEHLKLVEEENRDDSWGWKDWQSNPFKHFYTRDGEESWKSKMSKYSLKQEPENKDMNLQVELEIEFDIANWLLKEVEKVFEKRFKQK